MKERVLARRYARALFELAAERGVMDRIHEDVRALRSAVQQSADLRLVFHSQEISKQEKQAVIAALLQGKASPLFLNFFQVLLRKSRERLYETVASEFDALVDRHRKKLHAATVTAVPLDSAFLGKLKSLLDRTYQADVDIECRVDPSILGGIVVRVDGQVFDGSLQSQLRRLRSQLSERTNSRLT